MAVILLARQFSPSQGSVLIIGDQWSEAAVLPKVLLHRQPPMPPIPRMLQAATLVIRSQTVIEELSVNDLPGLVALPPPFLILGSPFFIPSFSCRLPFWYTHLAANALGALTTCPYPFQ